MDEIKPFTAKYINLKKMSIFYIRRSSDDVYVMIKWIEPGNEVLKNELYNNNLNK